MIALSLLLIAMTSQQADTTAPAAAMESPYPIHSAGLELAGTLTIPRAANKPVPVVVIIAGSGPTDRDGPEEPYAV